MHDSEPAFGPNTEVFHDLKLDSDEALRPELDLNNFVLCDEIRRMFSTLDSIRNGTIEQVEVRAGVPRRIVFRDGDPMHG